MKKPSDHPDDGVQRESVRRAQMAGKRRAATWARRSIPDEPSSQRSSPDRHSDKDVSVPVPGAIRRFFVRALLVVCLALVIYAFVTNLRSGQLSLPAISFSPQAQQTATAVTPEKLIGIVSGHRGNDSGSVCMEGQRVVLTEAQVNYAIAERVAANMRSQGYSVDILDEFDTHLKNYHAALLLSIHADSCTYINDLATGFKVARVLDSKIPEEEDQLVACITSRYSASTGLHFHRNTVTFDMTKYHAFYEIDPRTPAAIIETGFLNLDRHLLEQQPELVAQGISNGLLCFLNHENPDSQK